MIAFGQETEELQFSSPGQMFSVLAGERLLDVRERPGGDGGHHRPGGLHRPKILCPICKYNTRNINNINEQCLIWQLDSTKTFL